MPSHEVPYPLSPAIAKIKHYLPRLKTEHFHCYLNCEPSLGLYDVTSPTLAAMVSDSYSPRIFEGEIERRVFLTAPVDTLCRILIIIFSSILRRSSTKSYF